MIKYTLKRIGMALLTLLIITFLLFVLVRIMPGNPFPSERMSAEQIQNKRHLIVYIEVVGKWAWTIRS